MECIFCKRNENEIQNAVTPIINDLQRQIKEKLEIKTKDLYENYAERNGFTLENFEKVETIKKRYLNMKIYRFQNKNDRNMFIWSDPNLKLLLDYFDNYKPLTIENTLYDLMSIFLKEPTADRLEMEIVKITEEENRIINKTKAENRIYYGYFSKKYNFPHFENKESSDCIGIAICLDCLKKFNISISDAIEAEGKMKIMKELPSNNYYGKYKIENSWLPRKSKHK